MTDLPLDPSGILTTLAKAGVEFVLIGALAVGVHAEVRATGDVDVMVPIGDEANKEKLAKALRKLKAQQLPGHLGGIEPTADDPHPTVVFRTRYGKLDILYKPDGSDAYPAVRRRSVIARVGGQPVAVVGKDDLIRMKLAAGRPNDFTDVANLTDGAGGRDRRVFVAMRLAHGIDEEWARDLTDERVKLFDPRGRVWIDEGLLKLEATRADLSDAQLELWAHALAERLAGAEVIEETEPSVEVDDG